MRNKMRYLVLCPLLFLTGMRDPFQPPEDLCAAGQLAQWRYHGMVKGNTGTGILQDGKKRWHRVSVDERVAVGWRVTAMDEHELTVDVGEKCEPKQWTWQREGTKKSEDKDSAVVDGAQSSRVGRRTQADHPRGG